MRRASLAVKKWLEGRREQPGRLSSEREKAQEKAFFAETGEIGVPHVQKPSQPRIGPANADATHLLKEPLESPRHLIWLLLRDPSSVDNQEHQMLAFLRQEQDMKEAYELAQQFGTMVRERQRDTRDAWLTACLASRIPDLETFAVGLQKEYAALKAALTLPSRNGPVEGQVKRLTFMKRSMYGRGGFELVRQRVVSAASLLSTKDAEDPDFWYHHTDSLLFTFMVSRVVPKKYALQITQMVPVSTSRTTDSFSSTKDKAAESYASHQITKYLSTITQCFGDCSGLPGRLYPEKVP